MFVSNNKATFSSDWIQQIPSSIALIDANSKVVSASPNWLKDFQLSLKEVEGQSIFKLFPELESDLSPRLSYSLDGLKDIKILPKANNINYGPKNSIWNINPWKDGYGNIVGGVIKVESISKTHELEAELSKAKIMLSEKSKIAEIGSWEYDLESKTLLWAPIIYKIYGVSKNFKPSLEKAFEFYTEGNSRETIKQVVAKAIASGEPWNEKLKLRKQNGTVIKVNSIGRPKFSDGTCKRIIGTLQNITDTSENRIEKSSLVIDEPAMFEKVPFGLAIIDYKSGKILKVNNVLLAFANSKIEDVENKNFEEFISLNLKNKLKSFRKQLLEKNAFEPEEFKIQKNGSKRLNLKVSGVFLNTAGRNKSILCTIENITAIKKTEKKLINELSISNQRTEELVTFAHMVSHNLKAHATNFSLLLNFLSTETGEKERGKFMTMLFNAADNLTNSIKGLREIVEVKENVKKEKKLIPLNESIFLIEQNLAGHLKECNGKIINEIPDYVNVKAIPVYLESILSNCITNAIKYRKENKSPLIILSVEDEEDYTVLSIEDNGQGIDLEKYGNQLFGLYNTFSRHKDARGIGLFLTKSQIEAMNGKITVDSELGQGSTFKIYFNKT